MRHPGLTVRQAEVLSAVRDWIALHGHSPTCRELGPVLGIGYRGAHQAMLVLERKGCLHRGQKDPGYRTLRLARPTPGPVGVHLASAVVAYEDGAAAGVAYQVTAVEPERQGALT